ncbi:hypothetical protein HUB98_27215 [Paenibacillus barcinonensis]|uniref:Uncharacterized protein n=1 Tax=Paenibacillus barcinonensis TaxID=198119 RepID=A0A2V4W9W4_PAEBA|nr:hypothetical protein [Paenibacillus barcinonensis]PYE52351.1 hypothetical protein DFQ00_101286 [Paenibacillus barcinonensis]QKS59532.1 hypothetical protein HUB98_27215 [Paenibacillus barcinonensis]
MKQVELTTDLRTASGEVQDIMVDGRYAGSLVLVYREGDRLLGSLQLDQEAIDNQVERLITDKAERYIRMLADAVGASHYEVLVSRGILHTVLQQSDMSSSPATGYGLPLGEQGHDDGVADEVNIIPAARDDSFTYEDPKHLLEMEMVSSGRSVSTYVFNDAEGEEMAEAALKQYGADAQGEIHWYEEPDEALQEAAAELLVRELDEEIIDTITIRMWYQGNELENLEWVHRDVEDDEDFADEDEYGETNFEDAYDETEVVNVNDKRHGLTWSASEMEEAEETCYVMLRSRDREFRVYDLYVQERGGLPVGTATIDMSHADLTGFMDYDVPGTSVQRKTLVEVLMRELNKEIEFNTLHLTMLYRNQIIDEARVEG